MTQIETAEDAVNLFLKKWRKQAPLVRASFAQTLIMFAESRRVEMSNAYNLMRSHDLERRANLSVAIAALHEDLQNLFAELAYQADKEAVAMGASNLLENDPHD